jgi:hypothetical protein
MLTRPETCLAMEVRRTGFPAALYNAPDIPAIFGIEIDSHRSTWTDDTTPRTDAPARFIAEEAWIGADQYRTLIVR